MAGGIGNRFWPVSNRRCPKQFSDILHCGKSFIRQTYERISQIFPNHRIFIITGEDQKTTPGNTGFQYIEGTLCQKHRPLYRLCRL